eukprot:15469555-Alexandrium_andersonii.AAC.1
MGSAAAREGPAYLCIGWPPLHGGGGRSQCPAHWCPARGMAPVAAARSCGPNHAAHGGGVGPRRPPGHAMRGKRGQWQSHPAAAAAAR